MTLLPVHACHVPITASEFSEYIHFSNPDHGLWQWGSQGIPKFNNFTKVMTGVCGRAVVWTQASCTLGHLNCIAFSNVSQALSAMHVHMVSHQINSPFKNIPYIRYLTWIRKFSWLFLWTWFYRWRPQFKYFFLWLHLYPRVIFHVFGYIEKHVLCLCGLPYPSKPVGYICSLQGYIWHF